MTDSTEIKKGSNTTDVVNHILCHNIGTVEENVDKILNKNKDKLDGIKTRCNTSTSSYHYSRIDMLLKDKNNDFNVKKITLKKNGDHIYFIKKRTDAESNGDKKDIDNVIDEIIYKRQSPEKQSKDKSLDTPKVKETILEINYEPKQTSSDDSLKTDTVFSEEQKADILDEQLKKHYAKSKKDTTTNEEKTKQGFLNIFKKTKQKTDENLQIKKDEQSIPLNKEQIMFSDKSTNKRLTKGYYTPTTPQVKSIKNTKFSDEVISLKDNTLQTLGLTDKQWEELDFYALYEPFAYVEIIRDAASLDKRYVLIEAMLSEDEAKWLKFIKETLRLIPMRTADVESKGLNVYLKEQIEAILKEYNINMPEESKNKILYYIEKQYLGLDIIDALMRDPNIEDISCDGAGVPIFLYHREYGSLKSNLMFDKEEELSSFVTKLAQKCGKHISISEPMLDATMPDGSRIQMTLSTEVTAKGSTFTIRKFKEDPFSPPDLIEFNTMSSEMVAYMWMAVENGVNALIAGGTAAGKTSTLNALSLFIPREAKIVSIEETREINLPHPNWIPGVVRSGFGEVVGDKIVGEIDMYDLMKAALRQRPEYILVGEIRGREAYVLFQAMATGHTTYSTAHADSAQSLIHRLEGKPIEIPRIMLQALDIVCIQVTTRVKNKRARRCKQIIEIIDIDPTTKEILTNEVFRWDPIEDKYIYSGKSYVLESIRADKDMTREEMTNELRNRAKLLEWMNRMNIRDFREVSQIIAQYAEDPAPLLKKIKDNGS
ncbi:MAG: type II/IV secretion system ATPase subunit [Candidatus Thermoplasmatota archaeon]